MSPQTTTYILLGTVTVLVIYDVLVIGCSPPGWSISERIHLAARDYPVLPAALGFLCGHAFAVPGELLTALHQYCRQHPAVVFVVGFVLAMILWPVRI